MADALVNLPEDLLTQIDLEADRRGITREAVLLSAVREEAARSVARSKDLVKRMETAAENWRGPADTTEMIRQDRRRDDPS